MAAKDETGPSLRRALLASTAVSLGLLSVVAFGPLDDFPEGLLVLPLLLLLGLALLGCAIRAMVLAARVRRHGAIWASPLIVCILTVAMLQLVPFRQIALQGNFKWHRAERERIVARVEAGDLTPNVSYNASLIALGGGAPAVSAGNEIVVEPTTNGHYVLFLTLRGFRHTFAGFLHVPPGGDPAQFFEFTDAPPAQLVRYGPDWYFVAN